MNLTKEDQRDYPYVIAYLRYMRSYTSRIAREVALAREQMAPRTAVYPNRATGVGPRQIGMEWVLLRDLPLRTLENLKAQMERDGQDHAELLELLPKSEPQP